MSHNRPTVHWEVVATACETNFTERVERHVHLVHAAAMRLAPDAADDLTQATFLVLLRRPSAADRAASRPGGLSAWLLATVRNLARNHQKRQRRRTYHEHRATIDFVGSDPAEALAWQELKGVLDDALATLPAAHRRVLVLRYFEQMPTVEVARELDCSSPAARQRVSRALESLRRKLASRGVELPAVILASALLRHASTAASPATLAACRAMTLGSASSLPLTTGASMTLKLTMTLACGGLMLTAVGDAVHGEPTTQPATQSAEAVAAEPTLLERAAALDAQNLPADGFVIERTLLPQSGDAEQLDLDTGLTFGRNRLTNDAFDVTGEATDLWINWEALSPGLWGFGPEFKPAVAAAFDLEPGAEAVAELWRQRGFDLQGFTLLADHLPQTYLFRTTHGAGGVLQIVEAIPTDVGEGDEGREVMGVRLRYRILTRGEGQSVAERVDQKQMNGTPWADPDRQAIASAMRQVLMVFRQYEIDHNDELPADLETIYASAPSLRKLKNLPPTMVYVPPPPFDPKSPRATFGPVLFSADMSETSQGTPVFVGFGDGSLRTISDPAELAEYRQEAGLSAAD